MPDEFDKPIEEEQSDDYGEDAEVPLVIRQPESSPDEQHTKEKTHSAKDYITPALNWVRHARQATWLRLRETSRSSNFWTALATVVIAVSTIFYTIYAKRQWREIHDSSGDTHDLAVAAGKQADAVTQSLVRTDKLVGATSDLATQAKRSADLAHDAIHRAASDSAQNAIRIERQLTILQDQAKAARDQADAALKSAIAIQKQTDISERPWLSVDATPGGLIFVNGEQAALKLKLSIRNVGKSIAKGIQADAKLFPTAVGLPVAIDAARHQRELCDHPATDEIGVFDLFPIDHPVEREVDISVIPSAIAPQAATYQGGEKPRRFVGFYVVGCVSYHSSFGTEIHQTRFAYHLIGFPTGPDGKFLILPDGTPLMSGFEIGVNVPQDKIGMMQELFSYNDAN